MSLFHGKNGKVVWNAEDTSTDVDIQHVLSWGVDASADVAETTEMAATGCWKTFVGGFKSWTATVECNVDSGGPDISYTTGESTTAHGEQGIGATWDDSDASPQTKVYIEMWFTQSAAGGILYGPAICTGISVNQDKDDVPKVTYTFQGNGALTHTTTEPSTFTG